MAETHRRPEGADDAELQRLRAEVTELKAENEELHREVVEPEAPTAAARTSARPAIAVIGIVLASLLLSLALPAVWLNRMVTNTAYYVQTVAPLASNAEIQNAIANKASSEIIGRIDAEGRLKQVLPANLQMIAAPIGSAVDDFVRKQAFALVRSKQFEQLWVTVNQTSHKMLVAAVTGKSDGVANYEAGTISLDLSAVADAIKAKLVASGLGIANNIPTSGLSTNYVLYRSSTLAQMAQVVGAILASALWLPLVGFALGLASIAIAVDRRRAVVWLGAGIAIAGILPINAIYFGQFYATAQIVKLAAIPSGAAQAAFQIIFRDLLTAERALTFLGVVAWLGAIAVGPSGAAVALRSGLSGGLSGVAAHLELGAFGEWVAARRKGLRLAGIPAVFLLLASMPAPRTITQIVWLTVALLVWVFAVELVAAAGAHSASSATNAPDAGTDTVTPGEG